jgi:hypothetical protein
MCVCVCNLSGHDLSLFNHHRSHTNRCGFLRHVGLLRTCNGRLLCLVRCNLLKHSREHISKRKNTLVSERLLCLVKKASMKKI